MALTKVTTGVIDISGLTVALATDATASGLKANLDLKANITSTALTGVPTAPTAANGTNTTQIATTAFVLANAGGSDPLKANLASPALTGVPTAPTAANGTDTTQVATTAFVTSGPTFTGVPVAPTAAAGTNTTQLATTAFVEESHSYLSKSVAGAANVTLTDAEASKRVIHISGAITTNIYLLFPATKSGSWIIMNNTTGAFTVTLRYSAGGTSIVASKDNTTIEGTGTNMYDANIGMLTAKAWANFDGSSTIGVNATVKSSYNISSITHTGNGKYTLTFTTAMSNANYVWAGTGQHQGYAIFCYGDATMTMAVHKTAAHLSVEYYASAIGQINLNDATVIVFGN